MRLLMVGADHQALEALDRSDLEITVLLGGATKNIGLPIPSDVRTILVDDPKDIDSALNGLYRAGTTEFDAVYSYEDPGMMVAAAIGAVLGANAVPARTVALFRDKYQQKRRVAQAGLPVTRHEFIEDIKDLPPGYELPFAKAVIKPVAGQATTATYVVSSTAELARLSAGMPVRNVIVEEFVPGEEWFADGIVSGGQIRFCSLSRYAQPCLSAVRDKAPVRTFSLDPIVDKGCYELATPLVTAALAALGHTDGVFHLEMFERDGTLTFSECAARRGGGPIRDQVKYKFGVDLADLCVRALLESIADMPGNVRDGVVASAFLPLVEGTLLAYPSMEEMLAQPEVVHARMFVPQGLRVASTASSTFFRMGEVTVHTGNYDSALQRLDEVAAWFASRLDVLPLNQTMRELWASPRNVGVVHSGGTL